MKKSGYRPFSMPKSAKKRAILKCVRSLLIKALVSHKEGCGLTPRLALVAIRDLNFNLTDNSRFYGLEFYNLLVAKIYL